MIYRHEDSKNRAISASIMEGMLVIFCSALEAEAFISQPEKIHRLIQETGKSSRKSEIAEVVLVDEKNQPLTLRERLEFVPTHVDFFWRFPFDCAPLATQAKSDRIVGNDLSLRAMIQNPVSTVNIDIGSVASGVQSMMASQAIFEIEKHGHENGMPASITSMIDDRCLFANSWVRISSGVNWTELVRLPSNRPYFPSDEYTKFRAALLGSAKTGEEAEIKYKASQITGEMMDRHVRGRIILIDGEPCRIIKTMSAPVSIVS